MSVSDELLCSFELLKPLDSSALKSHIKKGRNKRNSILNSPVSLLSTRYIEIPSDKLHSLRRFLPKAFSERENVKVWKKKGFGVSVMLSLIGRSLTIWVVIEAFPIILASWPIIAVAIISCRIEHTMRRNMARAISHIRVTH